MTTTILRGQSAPVGPYAVRVVRVEGQHVMLDVTGPADGAGVREAAERLLNEVAMHRETVLHGECSRFSDDIERLARHALASPPPAGGEGDDGVFRELVEAVGKMRQAARGMAPEFAAHGASLKSRANADQWAGAYEAMQKAHDRAADALRRRGGEGEA